MALPAIKEDAKMQSKVYDVVVSPVPDTASLNCTSVLSQRSNSFVVAVFKKPIKPKFVRNSPTNNLTLSWKSWTHEQKTQDDEHKEDDFVPMRRRFHSSDIIIRPSGKMMTKKTSRFFEFGDIRDGNKKHKCGLNARCRDIGEVNEDDEPVAEPDHLALRRRTRSENFTTSAAFSWFNFHKLDSFYHVDDLKSFDDQERWKVKQGVMKERQQTSKNARDQLPVEFQEDLEKKVFAEDVAEGRCMDDHFDGVWSSQSLAIQQAGVSSKDGRRSESGSWYSVKSDEENLEKLRNLQKLYQEGFITITEYKDRRAQLVGELSEVDQTIAKTSDLLSLELPIVYREPPDFSLLRERDAIKHVFDSEQRTWTTSRIKIKIDAEPFANGGLRQVFHLQDLSIPPPTTSVGGIYEDSVIAKCTSHVAKIAIDPNENPDTYFKDVEMQAVAAKYAKLYNSYNPPRRVEFLEACILQLIPAGASEAGDQTVENLTLSGTICGVEPFIAGEYHKHNNNFGYVSELERNTPQAFSHFTYEASGQQIIVVDIQGVGDHYTDPQIHSRRGKEFGKGNLALRGFARFLGSHRCNPICRYLKLPLVNPKDEENRQVDLKGTIPAQTYMSQTRVAVDQVDAVLCHYYGNSRVFKRYAAAKTKREKKKRGIQKRKSHSRPGHDEKWQRNKFDTAAEDDCSEGESIECGVGGQQAGNRFAAALVDQQRSCSSFVCNGFLQCIVS
ncbi:unnamed protein product [Peronospora belbahrii]|uniref:Alpha-type protein kinase domain-containing protein n=1 Tax=Peronospora belbahrii TaxID=622444 RepID=A0AAU9KUZ0_9STRA|nr:unnamed protein product [Peronospora belbahrii]